MIYSSTPSYVASSWRIAFLIATLAIGDCGRA
jgi:hypothetical protein